MPATAGSLSYSKVMTRVYGVIERARMFLQGRHNELVKSMNRMEARLVTKCGYDATNTYLPVPCQLGSINSFSYQAPPRSAVSIPLHASSRTVPGGSAIAGPSKTMLDAVHIFATQLEQCCGVYQRILGLSDCHRDSIHRS